MYKEICNVNIMNSKGQVKEILRHMAKFDDYV